MIATGELGVNLDRPTERRCSGIHTWCARPTSEPPDFAGGPQVVIDPGVDLADQPPPVGDKEAAIHVIRYDYDEERDEVPVLDRMTLDVRLSRPFRMVKVLSPIGEVATGSRSAASVARCTGSSWRTSRCTSSRCCCRSARRARVAEEWRQRDYEPVDSPRSATRAST